MAIPLDPRQARNLRLLIIIMVVATAIGWIWGQVFLPLIMDSIFHVPADEIPQRTPLFEGAPFNDYSDTLVFPDYGLAFGWGLPPAEQIRSWFKAWMQDEFGVMLGVVTPFFIYNLIGIVLNFYGMIRLTRAITGVKVLGGQVVLMVTAITMLMYPLHFALDRGNQALHNTGFIFLGIALFLENRNVWSVINLCLAGCSKITPYALGLMFILERRWKAAAGMALLGSALVIVPTVVLMISHQYDIGMFFVGQEAYKDRYALGNSREIYSLGLGYGTSLFSLLKLLVTMSISITNGIDFKMAQTLALPYFPPLLTGFGIAMALVGLDLAWISLRRRTKASVFAALMCVYLLMSPHVIADYYLTIAAVPMLVFALDKEVMHDRLAMVLAALLLVPKTFFWLYQDFLYLPMIPSTAVLFNAAIVTMLYVVIRVRHVGRRAEMPS